MMNHPGSNAAAIVLIATALAAWPAEAEPIGRVMLSDVEEVANPKIEGVSAAFLVGTFDADGLYAAQSTMKAGAIFPPHKHPDQRFTHVLSGTMYLAEGETVDEASLVAYPAGTVALTPPDTWHYMVARDGDFTVLEIGSGPSGTEFSAK